MENLDFLLDVLEDYCHLQTSGEVAPANRYSVTGVRDLINELEAEQVGQNEKDREIAKLKNELEVMAIQVEQLKKSLVDDATSKILLEKLAIENGQMNVSLSGNIFHIFCSAFVNTFKEAAAENYLVAEFHSDELGPFTVTMQRSNGLTVYQKLSVTKRQRDELAVRMRHLGDAASYVLKSRDKDGITTSGLAGKFDVLQVALDEAQGERFEVVEARIRISELENLAVDLSENYFLHKESHDCISERINRLSKDALIEGDEGAD